MSIITDNKNGATLIEFITFNAKNAFGIGSMSLEFSFLNNKREPRGRCMAIYAPNGTGKTSLLKSIELWTNGSDPKDEFLGNDGSFSITTVPPKAIRQENVHCFKTRAELDELHFFNSAVLASPELTEQYEGEIRNHNERRAALLGELGKTIFGGKGGSDLDALEQKLISAAGGKELVDSLEILSAEAFSYIAPSYIVSNKMDKLLSSSNLKALSKPEVAGHLTAFAEARNEVIASSGIMVRGFDYVNASELGKQLDKLLFFKAGHSVVLHNEHTGENIIVRTVEEYRKAIEDELRRAEDDERAREEYKKADEALGRTAASQTFRSQVCADPELAADLSDPDAVERSFLLHAVQQNAASVSSYVASERLYEKSMRALSEKASIARTDWDDAVALFIDRFRVPFTPKVANRPGAVTGTQVPVIEFDYGDTRVDNEVLFRNLSEGERKALYMLYIIFEVERAKHGGGNKLLVFDDVVDSFDYVNKYAFIEYLGEFTEDPTVYVLLLTHNFDFFRTVTNRLGGNFNRNNCKLAEVANQRELLLRGVDYIEHNVMERWRKDVKSPDSATRMAAIPMVRELAVIQGAERDEVNLLSDVLHGRKAVKNIRFCDLDPLFKKYWKCDCLEGDERPVNQTVLETCDTMEAEDTNGCQMALPEKVILSMGIRFLTERCIVSELSQAKKGIVEGSLGKIARALKDELPESYEPHAALIEQAVLMTPENIHLNSFMYEPLIDIGIHRLFALYRECKTWREEIEG